MKLLMTQIAGIVIVDYEGHDNQLPQDVLAVADLLGLTGEATHDPSDRSRNEGLCPWRVVVPTATDEDARAFIEIVREMLGFADEPGA